MKMGVVSLPVSHECTSHAIVQSHTVLIQKRGSLMTSPLMGPPRMPETMRLSKNVMEEARAKCTSTARPSRTNGSLNELSTERWELRRLHATPPSQFNCEDNEPARDKRGGTGRLWINPGGR